MASTQSQSRMEGPLSKWTNLVNGWQYRWFVLDRAAGLLSYYTSKEKMIRGDRRGCVKLKLAQVGIDDEDDSTFTITTYDNKSFHFQARDADERHKWLDALQETRDIHSTVAGPPGLRRVAVGRNSAMISHGQQQQQHFPGYRVTPYTVATINAAFDQRLSEADAYLVLLLEQQKAFETRYRLLRSEVDDLSRREAAISGNGNAESTIAQNNSRARRTECEALLTRLQSICSLIKQTVMSLQMSRHTLYNPLTHPVLCSKQSQHAPSLDAPIGGVNSIASVSTPLGAAVTSINSSTRAGNIGQPRLEPSSVSAVPQAADALTVDPTQLRAPLTNDQTVAAHEIPSVHSASSEPVAVPTFLAAGDGSPGHSEEEPQGTVKISPEVSGRSSGVEIGQDVLLGPTIIPEMSYSSSEDEEFFDTEEFLNSPKHSLRGSESRMTISSSLHSTTDNIICNNSDHSMENPDLSSHENGQELTFTQSPFVAEGDYSVSCNNSSTIQPEHNIYYDELYDNQVEQGLGSVKEAHGSVISHLVSQVRIGMDLTKIVLPTFILEKRSTLEMYADFLAHADLWAMIAEGQTPEDRMVRCLRWYLSAFHAGRRSSVAKKPYNPILGEIFQCYWPLRDDVDEESTVRENNSTQGPCSWAPDNSVTFIAEQVSHHPPISAFYAEQANRRISVDGYIWTRSKFLGLSIAVHMVGQAVISLLDYGEEYTVNFPSGYGRSIFTVPWIELGGNCSIVCAKTGWESRIQFKTKPFYGGSKDLVKAEVFSPHDRRRPTMVVEGQWNDRMDAKWMNNQGNVVRQENFVDTKKMPVMRKCVLPRTEQCEYESRRLWQDVTYNLKIHNIEAATNAKSSLEQRQRDEARERRELGQKWDNRYFHEVGEHWVYHDPLCKRLAAALTASSNTETDSQTK